MLDCHTREYQTITLYSGANNLLIADTRQKHDNSAEDEYNTRVRECDEALSLFQQRIDISFLSVLTQSDFEQHREVFKDAPILN